MRGKAIVVGNAESACGESCGYVEDTHHTHYLCSRLGPRCHLFEARLADRHSLCSHDEIHQPYNYTTEAEQEQL
jgi:hypothetical protein